MKAIAFVCALTLSAGARAAIVVTGATVTHVFQGDPQFGSTSVPLDNASPGNHFNTFDGNVGAKLDIDSQSGSLQLNTMLWRNPAPAIGYSTLKPEGVIRFTAIDGDFSLGAVDVTGSSSGTYILTQLASGQTHRIAFGRFYFEDTGPLGFPAPKGDYELSFAGSTDVITGQGTPGYTRLAFTITPEPLSLSASAGLMLLSRRRVS